MSTASSTSSSSSSPSSSIAIVITFFSLFLLCLCPFLFLRFFLTPVTGHFHFTQKVDVKKTAASPLLWSNTASPSRRMVIDDSNVRLCVSIFGAGKWQMISKVWFNHLSSSAAKTLCWLPQQRRLPSPWLEFSVVLFLYGNSPSVFYWVNTSDFGGSIFRTKLLYEG